MKNKCIRSQKYLYLNIIYASDCEISMLFRLFWCILFQTKKLWKLASRLQYFQGVYIDREWCQQKATQNIKKAILNEGWSQNFF